MIVPDKVNILMVDDQPSKLLTYEAILAELGENLIKANSGREALELLLKTDIAVVLMDVSMPELDGFELAEIIRQHPRFQKTAIIFISAVHLTDLDRLKGYQRGAVDYLSVPVVPELLRTQDEERRRIARDLHDGLGQELSAAKMLVDGIHMGHQSVEAKDQAALQASGLLERVMQQVRSISHLLHPPLLYEIGLQSALRWYLDGLTERSGIETVFDVDPPEFPRLAPEVETTVFRIVQEALTNVFRHSGAMKACITLTKNDHQVAVSVRDFGKGIAGHIVELRPGSVGIGLGGMRQRAKEFGGELRLKNAQ